MAGLVRAISLRKATLCLMIEIAGTSPAMTKESVGTWRLRIDMRASRMTSGPIFV